jgi:hypothetical protein
MANRLGVRMLYFNRLVCGFRFPFGSSPGRGCPGIFLLRSVELKVARMGAQTTELALRWRWREDFWHKANLSAAELA